MKMLETKRKLGTNLSGRRKPGRLKLSTGIAERGVPGIPDMWRADWGKRGWREQEGSWCHSAGRGLEGDKEMAKTDPRVICGTKGDARDGAEVKMIPRFLVWTTEGQAVPFPEMGSPEKAYSFGEKMLVFDFEMSGCRYH